MGPGTIAPSEVTPLIRAKPMSLLQITAITLCVVMNLVDGFDVLAMAFAAPTIAQQWSVPPEELGLLLSAGLLGMGLGALFMSPLADIWGRRRTILTCLVVVGTGMLWASVAGSVGSLIAARVYTGVGIGAMLSSNISLVTEYSSAKRLGLATGLMAVGFPLGATIGGGVAAVLIGNFGWRSVFLVGGIGTLALIPPVFFFLPESLDFLTTKGTSSARAQANRLLEKMGLPPLGEKQMVSKRERGNRFAELISAPVLGPGLKLSIVFLLLMFSFYFVVNWAPQLVVQGGQTPQAGVLMGTLINLGGTVGALSAGLLFYRFGLRNVTAAAILVMAVAIAAFGFLLTNDQLLVPLSFAMGFLMYAPMTGIWPMIATSFPASVRVTAVGVVATAGRVGSVLGPLCAGVLLGRGVGPTTLCILLAVPALVASLVLRTSRYEEIRDGAPVTGGSAGVEP